MAGGPYIILRQLQQDVPVYYDEQFGRYVVTRHDGVQSVVKNRDYWVDGRKGNPGTFRNCLWT